MRVSNRATSRNYLKYLTNAQSASAKTNEQIFSGNRFKKISDDVSAGTRVMRTRMDLYKAEKHLDNVTSVAEELATVESTMTSINDLLKTAHGLALKATSENNEAVGKDALANEIKNIKEQVLHLANSKFGKKYIFGGSNASMAEPFTMDKVSGKLKYNGILVDEIQKDADGYFYNDAAGDRTDIPMDEEIYMDVGLGIRMTGSQIDTETGYLISYSGIDLLGFGKNADGVSNNIFNVLADLENNIRNYDSDKIGAMDTQLTLLTDKFRGNLTNIGGKTSFLDTMQDRLKNNVDGYKEKINSLMGADPAEAAMKQSTNEYVLKAVLQMGAKLLPVSLLDFLR